MIPYFPFSARPRVLSEAEVGPDAVGGHGRKIRLGNEAEGHHWRSNLEADEPFRQILGFPEVHSSVRSPTRRRVRPAVDEHLSDAGVRDEEEKALADREIGAIGFQVHFRSANQLGAADPDRHRWRDHSPAQYRPFDLAADD